MSFAPSRIQNIYKVFSKSFNVLLICVKKTRDQLHETFFYWMLHWCAMMMKMRAHASELSKRSWGLSSTTSPYAILANPIGKISLSKADLCVLLEMKKKMYSRIREGVKQNKQETIQGLIFMWLEDSVAWFNKCFILNFFHPLQTEYIRKFSWVILIFSGEKPLFQNNLRHIAFFFSFFFFFFTLFKGYGR